MSKKRAKRLNMKVFGQEIKDVKRDELLEFFVKRELVLFGYNFKP